MTRAVKSTILTPPLRKKRPESLTSREREILELIWAGFRNKEIGQRLKISVKTVEAHRASMMTKMRVSNTAQLLKSALQDGTIVPPNVFRLLRAHGVAEAIRARCWFRRDLRFYACDEKNILALPRAQFLRRDCFDDLDYYAQHERGQMSPEAFRSESTKRQSLGYHLYTLVQDGRLVFYAWLVDRQARSEDPLLGQVFFPPTDASIVFDCFTHPTDRGKGIYYRALCQMLHDARDIGQARQACMAAYADNRISCHVIEKLGFYYIGSMIKQRRLFKAHRCAVAVHHTFQTALL